MKNRIIFALALFVLALSSCQQDEFSELAKSTGTPQISADQQAPHGAAEAVDFKDVKRQEFPKEKIETPQEVTALIAPDRELANQVTERSGVEISIALGSTDNSEAYQLKCGQTTYGTTYGENNRYGSLFYSQFGLRAGATGSDTEFIFEVTQPTVVDWNIFFPAGRNMIALLFAGDYNVTGLGGGVWVDEHGIVHSGTPSYTLHLTYNRYVAMSHGPSHDHIDPLVLNPGKYIMILETAPHNNANISIITNCITGDSSCDGIAGTSIQSDDMDSHHLGNLSPQAVEWTKMNPYAPFDARIGENGGNQYMYMQRKAGYNNANQPDVLYNLGTRNSGRYQLHFDMWIFNNRSGHFNIVKDARPGNIGNEIGTQVSFMADGTMWMMVSDFVLIETYPQNQWMDIMLDFNFYTNRTTLYINGIEKGNWSNWERTDFMGWGSNQVEALNFFPLANTDQIFVDNMCFTQL